MLKYLSPLVADVEELKTGMVEPFESLLMPIPRGFRCGRAGEWHGGALRVSSDAVAALSQQPDVRRLPQQVEELFLPGPLQRSPATHAQAQHTGNSLVHLVFCVFIDGARIRKLNRK